ncbi:hypothetical protein [Dongia deserti]|uniref:hypothetical protein n=1 Tax=Dongia deserti TaxID=2268030 RepID=UPI0013C4E7A2|nr:hypothetical protein [Dongia deserti]
MKPVTYDFDVITDTPAPQRRAPEQVEKAPQANAEEERRRTASLERSSSEKIRAAE